MSLELALFLAQLTGSAVYTDNPAQWKHLHAHALSAEARRQSSAWGPLVQQIRKIDFTLESSPQALIGIRLSVKLRATRNTLRKIWQTLRLQGLVINTAGAVQELLHDLTAAEELMGKQWSAH
jgi:hypothetical protein